MEAPIKCLVLREGTVLISEISPKTSEDDDSVEWQLVKPFIFKKTENTISLEPWLCDYTSKSTFMIYSDSILTITDPNKEHLKTYIDLTS